MILILTGETLIASDAAFKRPEALTTKVNQNLFRLLISL